MASTITITQGEDFTLNLAFTNANGSAYNLTGSTVTLLVRKNQSTAITLYPAGATPVPAAASGPDRGTGG